MNRIKEQNDSNPSNSRRTISSKLSRMSSMTDDFFNNEDFVFCSSDSDGEPSDRKIEPNKLNLVLFKTDLKEDDVLTGALIIQVNSRLPEGSFNLRITAKQNNTISKLGEGSTLEQIQQNIKENHMLTKSDESIYNFKRLSQTKLTKEQQPRPPTQPLEKKQFSIKNPNNDQKIKNDLEIKIPDTPDLPQKDLVLSGQSNKNKQNCGNCDTALRETAGRKDSAKECHSIFDNSIVLGKNSLNQITANCGGLGDNTGDGFPQQNINIIKNNNKGQNINININLNINTNTNENNNANTKTNLKENHSKCCIRSSSLEMNNNEKKQKRLSCDIPVHKPKNTQCCRLMLPFKKRTASISKKSTIKPLKFDWLTSTNRRNKSGSQSKNRSNKPKNDQKDRSCTYNLFGLKKSKIRMMKLFLEQNHAYQILNQKQTLFDREFCIFSLDHSIEKPIAMCIPFKINLQNSKIETHQKMKFIKYNEQYYHYGYKEIQMEFAAIDGQELNIDQNIVDITINHKITSYFATRNNNMKALKTFGTNMHAVQKQCVTMSSLANFKEKGNTQKQNFNPSKTFLSQTSSGSQNNNKKFISRRAELSGATKKVNANPLIGVVGVIGKQGILNPMVTRQYTINEENEYDNENLSESLGRDKASSPDKNPVETCKGNHKKPVSSHHINIRSNDLCDDSFSSGSNLYVFTNQNQDESSKFKCETDTPFGQITYKEDTIIAPSIKQEIIKENTKGLKRSQSQGLYDNKTNHIKVTSANKEDVSELYPSDFKISHAEMNMSNLLEIGQLKDSAIPNCDSMINHGRMTQSDDKVAVKKEMKIDNCLGNSIVSCIDETPTNGYLTKSTGSDTDNLNKPNIIEKVRKQSGNNNPSQFNPFRTKASVITKDDNQFPKLSETGELLTKSVINEEIDGLKKNIEETEDNCQKERSLKKIKKDSGVVHGSTDTGKIQYTRTMRNSLVNNINNVVLGNESLARLKSLQAQHTLNEYSNLAKDIEEIFLRPVDSDIKDKIEIYKTNPFFMKTTSKFSYSVNADNLPLNMVEFQEVMKVDKVKKKKACCLITRYGSLIFQEKSYNLKMTLDRATYFENDWCLKFECTMDKSMIKKYNFLEYVLIGKINTKNKELYTGIDSDVLLIKAKSIDQLSNIRQERDFDKHSKTISFKHYINIYDMVKHSNNFYTKSLEMQHSLIFFHSKTTFSFDFKMEEIPLQFVDRMKPKGLENNNLVANLGIGIVRQADLDIESEYPHIIGLPHAFWDLSIEG